MNGSTPLPGRTKCDRCTADSPLATRLASGDWPPADQELRVIKCNRKVASGFVRTTASNQPELFFKHYVTKPGLLARRAAKRTWKISWYLHNQGVPVPRPQALVIEDSGVWFITEAAVDSAALTERLADNVLTPEQTQAVTTKAAQAIAHIHDLGVIHGDLKWGNILVTQEMKPVLVDLDSSRRRWRVGARAGAKDLARFVVGGLEQGLDATWAARICSVYCDARSLSKTRIYNTMRPIVRRISLRHQKRYNRRPVSLDIQPEHRPNDNVRNSG